MSRKLLLVLVLGLAFPASASAAVTNAAPSDAAAFTEGTPITLQWNVSHSGDRPSSVDIEEIATDFDNDTENEYWGLSPFGPQTSLHIGNPEPGLYRWSVNYFNCAVPNNSASCTFGLDSTPTTFGIWDLLSLQEAKHYLRKAARRYTYQGAYFVKQQCRLATDFAANCKFVNYIGDVHWKGRLRIYFHDSDLVDNVTRYHAQGRIRKVNEFCVYINEKPDKKCKNKKRIDF